MSARMLASVLDAGEAEVALATGADIIDLKDPRQGALGALPLGTVAGIVAAVAQRRPVSATLGDLPMEPGLLVARAAALADCGVDFVKIGLFADPRQRICIAALAPLAARQPLVAVLFADQRPDFAVMADLAAAGFAGVMLDTAHKARGGLRACLPDETLGGFIATAAGSRLFSGLAGSLAAADIPALLRLEPDYLGFRGALCAGAQRTARLHAAAVASIRLAMPRAEGDAAGVRPGAFSAGGRDRPPPASAAAAPAPTC